MKREYRRTGPLIQSLRVSGKLDNRRLPGRLGDNNGPLVAARRKRKGRLIKSWSIKVLLFLLLLRHLLHWGGRCIQPMSTDLVPSRVKSWWHWRMGKRIVDAWGGRLNGATNSRGQEQTLAEGGGGWHKRDFSFFPSFFHSMAVKERSFWFRTDRNSRAIAGGGRVGGIFNWLGRAPSTCWPDTQLLLWVSWPSQQQFEEEEKNRPRWILTRGEWQQSNSSFFCVWETAGSSSII